MFKAIFVQFLERKLHLNISLVCKAEKCGQWATVTTAENYSTQDNCTSRTQGTQETSFINQILATKRRAAKFSQPIYLNEAFHDDIQWWKEAPQSQEWSLLAGS